MKRILLMMLLCLVVQSSTATRIVMRAHSFASKYGKADWGEYQRSDVLITYDDEGSVMTIYAQKKVQLFMSNVVMNRQKTDNEDGYDVWTAVDQDGYEVVLTVITRRTGGMVVMLNYGGYDGMAYAYEVKILSVTE